MTTIYFRLPCHRLGLLKCITPHWDDALKCWYSTDLEACKKLRTQGLQFIAQTATPLHLRRHRAESERLQ